LLETANPNRNINFSNHNDSSILGGNSRNDNRNLVGGTSEAEFQMADKVENFIKSTFSKY
jgi:hypothetical protein